MAEENIYSDDNISVTTARIIVSGTTYALRNITSVKMTKTEGDSQLPFLLIVMGVIFMFIGLVKDVRATGFSFFFLIVGALLLTGGIASFLRVKPTFHVTIVSSSGEIRALSSLNRYYIEMIVRSINEAIIRYR